MTENVGLTVADKEYLEAADKARMHCLSSPYRTMEMSDKESALIDYILKKMHWCPFEDESGVDFTSCVGFGVDGCKECICRNTDKLLKEKESIDEDGIQQYRAVGTAGECRKAVERQKAVCRPEICGRLSPISTMFGTCRCGNKVSGLQHFCSECGVRLE